MEFILALTLSLSLTHSRMNNSRHELQRVTRPAGYYGVFESTSRRHDPRSQGQGLHYQAHYARLDGSGGVRIRCIHKEVSPLRISRGRNEDIAKGAGPEKVLARFGTVTLSTGGCLVVPTDACSDPISTKGRVHVAQGRVVRNPGRLHPSTGMEHGGSAFLKAWRGDINIEIQMSVK